MTFKHKTYIPIKNNRVYVLLDAGRGDLIGVFSSFKEMNKAKKEYQKLWPGSEFVYESCKLNKVV